MGPSFVQTVGTFTQSSTATSWTAPYGSNVAAGQAVLLAIRSTGSILLSSAVDTQGNTYKFYSQAPSGSAATLAWAYLTTAVTTSDTIALNFGILTGGSVEMYQYQNLTPLMTIGTQAFAGGAGILTTTVTAPAQYTGSLLVSVLSTNQIANTVTAPANMTLRGTVFGNDIALADVIAPDANSDSYLWSMTATSGNMSALLVEFYNTTLNPGMSPNVIKPIKAGGMSAGYPSN